MQFCDHPLDDVIWKALIGPIQNSLKENNCQDLVLKFNSEVSPLAAFDPSIKDSRQEHFDKLSSVVAFGGNAGLFLTYNFSISLEGWKVVICTPLMEMVYNLDSKAVDLRQPEVPSNVTLVKLEAGDVSDMIALVDLTKPGPFASRTYEMGDYFGLRNAEGHLVAMAGERLRIPQYTEISAVCTHPNHLGKGYAAFLLQYLMNRIINRGETPFLHVRPENTRAVKLYESLGFQNRVLLHYLLVNKVAY